MRIIEIIKYEADDGTLFDEYIDCFRHEVELNYQEIYYIDFYDENDALSRITNNNLYDDDIYNYCHKVVIHNDDELKALRWISECNGWWMFEAIDRPGIWEVTTVKTGERLIEVFNLK